MRTLLCLIAILSLVGCDGPQWVEITRPAEVPIANVPAKLRQTNWEDKNGSGSCVIASSISVFRWHNMDELAAYFRKAYAGGQTANSVKSIWARHKIPFRVEEDGNPEFLDWCSDTRRPAIIWFFPSHCVTFVGFSRGADGREVAWLLDNNRVQQFIPIEKNTFIRAWRGYGGFAMASMTEPAPPLPFTGYEVAQ